MVKKLYKDGKLFRSYTGTDTSSIIHKIKKERKMIANLMSSDSGRYIEFRDPNDVEGFSILTMNIEERKEEDVDD